MINPEELDTYEMPDRKIQHNLLKEVQGITDNMGRKRTETWKTIQGHCEIFEK